MRFESCDSEKVWFATWKIDMATLHPTRRIQALMPLYAQRFSCIGSACEDSCCSGWKVTIDKKTFNAYRQMQHLHIADRLETHVKRIRSQASDRNYARMELLPDSGDCALMEDRLCSVQKELGEDKLSNTCFTYPRSLRESGGVYQQALTLSCPEAARLALLAEDAFEFSTHEIAVRPDTVERVKAHWGLSVEQMNEVRYLCLQIVRTEGLQIWQKLALVGLFCESLSAALKNGEQRRLPEIMAETRALTCSDNLVALFDGMQAQYAIQAVTFAMLWQAKGMQIRTAHLPVYEAMATGLGADAETGQVSEAQLVERYEQGLALLPQALAVAPALLDNYVLNEMLHESFPFGLGAGYPQQQFLGLATRFGLVRFMLAVQCRAEAPLPSAQFLARTVQVFARRFQHDKPFAAEVDSCFAKAGWHQLDKIFKLLKA